MLLYLQIYLMFWYVIIATGYASNSFPSSMFSLCIGIKAFIGKDHKMHYKGNQKFITE